MTPETTVKLLRRNGINEKITVVIRSRSHRFKWLGFYYKIGSKERILSDLCLDNIICGIQEARAESERRVRGLLQ